MPCAYCSLNAIVTMICYSVFCKKNWYLWKTCSQDVGLQPLACWDCGHGYLSVVSVVCLSGRSLRRADPSSRGVLPTMVCHCVWSRNLMNEEAKTCKWVIKASKRRRRLFSYTVLRTECLYTGCFMGNRYGDTDTRKSGLLAVPRNAAVN
jgi:hypothetical protein